MLWEGLHLPIRLNGSASFKLGFLNPEEQIVDLTGIHHDFLHFAIHKTGVGATNKQFDAVHKEVCFVKVELHCYVAVRCLSPLEAMTVGGFAPPNPL